MRHHHNLLILCNFFSSRSKSLLKQLLIIASSLLLMVSCSKSSDSSSNPNPPPPPPPPGPSGPFDFLKNSQWVGTYHIVSPGTQYDPPCTIQFNAENSGVIVFSNFLFFNSTQTDIIGSDSLNGTIKSIKKVDANGNPNEASKLIGIEVTLTETNDTHKMIIDPEKDQLLSVTADANKRNAIISMNLSLFPVSGHSVSATGWKGKFNNGDSYPDVSGIQFIKDGNYHVTRYYRNGNYIHDAEQKVVQLLYDQKGARVYMSGFNEVNPSPGFIGRFVPYFGVISPDGASMWVHSTSMHSRLPYFGGSTIYGPVGSTPVLIKK